MATITCKHTNNTFNIGDMIYVTSATEKNGIVGSGIASSHTTKERLLSKRAHFHSPEDARSFCGLN